MRIGIITIQKSPNFGACLQAFALYDFLHKQNKETFVIDLLRPTHSEYKQSKKFRPFREIRPSFKSRVKIFLKGLFGRNKKCSALSHVAEKKFDSFNNRIQYTNCYYSIDQLYKNPPKFDILITGSDQLWNPTIGFCIEPYFLTFADNNVKKISYATSVGISELHDDEIAFYQKWLSEYDTISVREKSGADLISKIIDRKVEQISDPTFLLSKEEWMQLASCDSRKNKYILLFTLSYNRTLAQYTTHLSEESGIEMVYLCLNHPNIEDYSYEFIKDAGPSDFLNLIAYAEMVVTDSFHGSVFSMHLGSKNFFTYIDPNNKRGSRIVDMYKMFNLSNHILNSNLSQKYNDLDSIKVDKEKLDSMLCLERARCRVFLNSHIN